MAKLGEEQVMVARQMVGRGVSVRQVAQQLGVTEGALRYRLGKSAAEERPDGRSLQPTAVAGYEEAAHAILERLGCRRVSGSGRPVQARTVYETLVREFDYPGSYRGVVRYLRRRYGVPPVRAYRRVETPPGVQAQHDWFEAVTELGGERVRLPMLVGTLSHSRARFAWASREASQLAWHTGHLELFRRYGGVPLWVRIDNLKAGVASGAGPTAVVNASYRVFAQTCGFQVDPCRPARGSDKGKAERSVRTFRQAFGDLFRRSWDDLESLQRALDRRARRLAERLRCPVTGTSVTEAHQVERFALQPVPKLGEPFDVVVARRVSRDCLVSFEGRRYSVPFAWVGHDVEVMGTLSAVVIRAAGGEIARHPRRTPARLVLDPDHFEGASTDRVLRPTPLGRRARLQLAGLSGPSFEHLIRLPEAVALVRPIAAYVQLVEAAR
ncbi:MAG TPA: IS21 family transposase [Thermoanaerobaculia bacterium]|nr:IS21 family transposase [Thermoanaerobaculia bacterium]